MKKIFIIHGFQWSPNGGWRPWLMRELEKRDIYACALSMPDPEKPVCWEWIEEISRHVERNKNDEVYLIGHSLGGPAILRYLENTKMMDVVAGVILVSSPSEQNNNDKLDNFLVWGFDFKKIQSSCSSFSVIHGSNDTLVPLGNAQFLSEKLWANLVIVKDGGHLNGSSGCFELPQCLDVLVDLMEI